MIKLISDDTSDEKLCKLEIGDYTCTLSQFGNEEFISNMFAAFDECIDEKGVDSVVMRTTEGKDVVLTLYLDKVFIIDVDNDKMVAVEHDVVDLAKEFVFDLLHDSDEWTDWSLSYDNNYDLMDEDIEDLELLLERLADELSDDDDDEDPGEKVLVFPWKNK